MRVSIVIPAYNGTKYLSQTVQSVREQTFTDWELIIADDGSTDGTRAMAEEFAAQDSRIRVHAQPNRGKVAVCNEFIETARGEYIAILDHDDLYKPDKLRAQVEFLDNNPDFGMVFCAHDLINGDGEPLPKPAEWILFPRYGADEQGNRILVSDDDPWLFPYLVVTNCIPMLTHLMRRTVAQQNGRLDPACWPSDDWDWWIRYSRHSKIHKLPQVLATYRFHDSNYTLNWGKMGQSRRYISHKIQTDPTLTEQERRQVALGVVADRRSRAKASRYWASEAWEKGDKAMALRYWLRSARINIEPLRGIRSHG